MAIPDSGTRRRAAKVLVAGIVLGAALTSCSSSDIGTIPANEQHGPAVKIDPARGCPRTLGKAMRVTNRFPDRTHALLPAARKPSAGLVCAFAPPPNGRGEGRLRHSVDLDGPQARRLAAAIAKVSLAPAKGKFNCPAAFVGADAVIALRYAKGAVVELWYATSGCETLDNGSVLAFQGANPSFYDGFQSVYASLVPDP